MLNPYGVVYLPENRCNLPQVSEKMCRKAKILITYYFQAREECKNIMSIS